MAERAGISLLISEP